MRVLVADDDLTSRRILSAILQKAGHEPVVVVDGLEAVTALEGPDAPALALLDWDMPGLEGPEICRRLRLLETPTPPYLILLTGRGAKGDIVEGLEAGANDYISKPYDVGELRARIGVGIRMLELQAELVRARDALAYQAAHDALTGLPNRRAILAAFHEAVARAGRDGLPFAVGLCDLDHFKRVNDTRGHPAGDAVLASFAGTAVASLGPGESIGRYGGEEFLLLAPGCPGTPGSGPFERVRAAAAAAPVAFGPAPIPVTVSIGVAAVHDGATADEVLHAADEALYRAKAEGRDRVVHA